MKSIFFCYFKVLPSRGKYIKSQGCSYFSDNIHIGLKIIGFSLKCAKMKLQEILNF